MRWDDDPSSWALAVLLALGMAGGIVSPNPNQQPTTGVSRVRGQRSIASWAARRAQRSEARPPFDDGLRPYGRFQLRFAVERTQPDSRFVWSRCPVRHALDSTLRSLPPSSGSDTEWSWRLRGVRVLPSQEE